jgi:hypothetical protein
LRKPAEVETGLGVVKFKGFTGEVAYQLAGPSSLLKRGGKALRGSLILSRDLAREAFQAGSGLLTLQGGSSYPLTFLGHTVGQPIVYFELSFEASSMSRPPRPSGV